MFSTGGSLVTTPDNPDPASDNFPNQKGFDQMQSFFVGVEGRPASNIRASVNFNVVGNVAQNPINEIFYENTARPLRVESEDREVVLTDNNRLRLYNAEIEWNAKQFNLKYFYRTGHFHWGYEGDFFGLYPEANYGPNLDIYNGEINGVEIEGKGQMDGFTAAVGPQLWWGANPTMLFKYTKEIKHWKVTGIYHRDFETDITIDPLTGVRELDANQVRSGVIPPWPTERATLVFEKDFGKVALKLGAIWGGRPLNGSSFQFAEDNPNFDPNNENSSKYIIYEDKINSDDNWGAKAKVIYEGGKFNWYAQAAVQGLVANGGVDQTRTFTGWKLKDNGSGNQSNFLTGFTYTTGDFQIAPNFLFQKPLAGPIPTTFEAPARPRNILSDPFSVRGNRETVGGELLLTYDPTPATWMYQWDNDRMEDAKFAMSAGFVYRHLPTIQDAAIGILGNGRTTFVFPGSAPAQDLWEMNLRMVSKLNPEFGIIGNFLFGNGQANGDDERTITRYGLDIRTIYKKMKVITIAKFNDWGPFDYHRDFNLTFPILEFQNCISLSAAAAVEKITNLHPLPGIIMEWRRMSSTISKTIFPLFKEAVLHEDIQSTRIHPVVQVHTATGRVTISDPSLQMVPKEFEIGT